MKTLALACLTLLSAGQCYAQSDSPSPFLGEDPQSPKVQEFYQIECELAAKNNETLPDESERQQFVSNCVKDMAKFWPVGYEES